MQSISFEFDASELERALETASRQFPASSETVLKKESRSIAKDLKGRVDSEAEGHHYIKPAKRKRAKTSGKELQTGKGNTIRKQSHSCSYDSSSALPSLRRRTCHDNS
jgi:hypothetical protein